MGKVKKHKGRPIINGGRKIAVSLLLTKTQIDFLDNKISYEEDGNPSRSAVVRSLVNLAKDDNLI